MNNGNIAVLLSVPWKVGYRKWSAVGVVTTVWPAPTHARIPSTACDNLGLLCFYRTFSLSANAQRHINKALHMLAYWIYEK